MKTNFVSFIQIIAASLCLTVTSSSHAQGILLVNTSWTAQRSDGIGNGVIMTIAPNGDFSALFSYNGGSISQTISTTPGINYDLTFQAIQYDGITTSSASVNGNLLANFTPDDPFISPVEYYGSGNTIWENFDFNFTALYANTTISFTEQPGVYVSYPANDPFWSKSGLDSISVTAAPEPSSLALLGVGLVSLFACRRQRRLAK
jgi:hypothetical protein